MKKVIICILVAFLGLSLGSCNTANPVINYTPNYNYTEVNPEPTSLEETVAKVYDSVVSIDSFIDNQLYGSGSGILISYDSSLDLSYILTCYHVIEGANNYKIIINGHDKYINSELVGGDRKNDIALLSIKGTNYSYANLSKNPNLRLASTVIAIGNPLGSLPGSVSIGHVSYLGREVMSPDYNTMKLIQTDTAINSGNSGGGLFDIYGNLVGVVNAKFAKAGVEGLGFAIPMDTAFSVIDDVFSTAKYDKGTNKWKVGYKLDNWELGFTVSDIVSFPFKYLGISAVSNNKTTSGFDKFMTGDQILRAYYKDGLKVVEFNISSAGAFYQSLYRLNLKVGDSFYVDINRKNMESTVKLDLVQYIPS